MKFQDRSLFFFIIADIIITFFYLRGVADVPFHPDESTYLYTSEDVELFWRQPSALFWQPDQENDPRQRYRELDAPLTNNLIALGRWVARQPSLATDWNWGLSWEENVQAGALPSQSQLIAGRMAFAVLFPFSLLFLFLTTRRVINDFAAWIAALLLASSALVLLHTRRSMAEGALLFTTILSLWSLVKAEKRPWLTSIPLALAFCAKQTLGALAPIGLLAVLWKPEGKEEPENKKRFQVAKPVLAFGSSMLIIIIFLNPFAWQQPIPAFQASVRARNTLLNLQIGDRPEQTLNSPSKKLIAMIGSLYLTPPSFFEVNNYTQDTREAEAAYMVNPLHALFRSIPAGGVLLVVSAFGFIIATRRFLVERGDRRRRLGLLLAATLLQTLALLVLIPLAWQRYYMPLVPFYCIWTAYGIAEIIRLGSLRRGSVDPAHRAAHLPEK